MTIDQAIYFSEDEILGSLKRSWGLDENEDIVVWSILNIGTNYQTDKNFYTIKSIKTKNNLLIEYPINDLDENQLIKRKGIYLPFNVGEKLLIEKEPNQELIIECKLVLADKDVRLKYNNPMLLQVDTEDLRVLKKIKKK